MNVRNESTSGKPGNDVVLWSAAALTAAKNNGKTNDGAHNCGWRTMPWIARLAITPACEAHCPGPGADRGGWVATTLAGAIAVTGQSLRPRSRRRRPPGVVRLLRQTHRRDSGRRVPCGAPRCRHRRGCGQPRPCDSLLPPGQ